MLVCHNSAPIFLSDTGSMATILSSCPFACLYTKTVTSVRVHVEVRNNYAAHKPAFRTVRLCTFLVAKISRFFHKYINTEKWASPARSVCR